MSTIRNLPALVRKQFKAAQESGDLTFYATRVSILQCEGLPVQKSPHRVLCNTNRQSSSNLDTLQLLQTSPNQINQPTRSQLIHLKFLPKVYSSPIYLRPTSSSSTNFPLSQIILYSLRRASRSRPTYSSKMI